MERGEECGNRGGVKTWRGGGKQGEGMETRGGVRNRKRGWKQLKRDKNWE
mgnify:CR=1 FL=1